MLDRLASSNVSMFPSTDKIDVRGSRHSFSNLRWIMQVASHVSRQVRCLAMILMIGPPRTETCRLSLTVNRVCRRPTLVMWRVPEAPATGPTGLWRRITITVSMKLVVITAPSSTQCPLIMVKLWPLTSTAGGSITVTESRWQLSRLSSRIASADRARTTLRYRWLTTNDREEHADVWTLASAVTGTRRMRTRSSVFICHHPIGQRRFASGGS